MSVFKLPSQLCHESKMMMSDFWWGNNARKRKIHWLSWNKMCRLKEQGGLGFRDLEAFNLAPLAKQGWRLLQEPDSLCAQILKNKYYHNSNFLRAKIGSNPSFTQRSTLEGKELLLKGVRWRIGSDDLGKVWMDPWIPCLWSFRPCERNRQIEPDLTVGELIDHQRGGWLLDKLSDLFSPHEIETIQKFPMSIVGGKDKLIWQHTPNGVFYVNSAYKVQRR